MTMMLIFFAIILVVLMGGSVLAYQFFGMWGLVGAIVMVLLVFKFAPRVIGWILVRNIQRAINPFAKALRGASVEVHSIERAPVPSPRNDDDEHGDEAYESDDSPDSDEDVSSVGEYKDPVGTSIANQFYDGPRNWYYVDVTIYPAMRDDGQPTEYLPWLPHLISLRGLAKEGQKKPAPLLLANMADGCCEVLEAIPWGDEEEPEDPNELSGPQRLRLYIGVQPTVKKLRFSYVGEEIGELNLPDN